mmetsp:Transcript_66276/g.197195  ORF Transcript_66276/g.197195 Transcript_66276/m.197195 type:complete len:258 (+) Transcript_66276:396-1169(+)
MGTRGKPGGPSLTTSACPTAVGTGCYPPRGRARAAGWCSAAADAEGPPSLPVSRPASVRGPSAAPGASRQGSAPPRLHPGGRAPVCAGARTPAGPPTRADARPPPPDRAAGTRGSCPPRHARGWPPPPAPLAADTGSNGRRGSRRGRNRAGPRRRRGHIRPPPCSLRRPGAGRSPPLGRPRGWSTTGAEGPTKAPTHRCTAVLPSIQASLLQVSAQKAASRPQSGWPLATVDGASAWRPATHRRGWWRRGCRGRRVH